jgi:ribose 5-phosphate isomerase A
MNSQELAKKLAAFQAVDEHIQNGQVIGIGSGSTVVYAVERIAEKVKEQNLKLTCIPTSFQAKQLIVANGLPLSDLEVCHEVDVTIDGCDECDQNLNLIKGGGGCLLQEKIVASASKKLIIVADYTKMCSYLGEKWKKGVPLEVSQFGHSVVLKRLNEFVDLTGCSDQKNGLRLALKKMGPVVTDNSNFIVDFAIGNIFQGTVHTPQSLNTWLKTIPGILETGLFVNMTDQVYFGMQDGTVSTYKRNVL